MNEIERQLLANHMAIMEGLISIVPGRGPNSTRELLLQRYRETAEIIRKQQLALKDRTDG